MPERMTVVVRGRDGLTVEDAMRQVLDTFELLQRSDPDPENPVVWRLVTATTNSPLTVVAEAVSPIPGRDVTSAARSQKRAFRKACSELRQGRVPRQWDSADTRKKARQFLRRTHNGVAATELFDDVGETPISITADVAKAAENALDTPMRSRKDEVGSVEGTLVSVDTYYHRPAFTLKERRSGRDIRVVVPDEFRSQFAKETSFDDVWREQRVSVRGTLHYSTAGTIEEVAASTISIIPEKHVSNEEITDPDFTGGASISDYLDEIREEGEDD